MSTSIKSLLGGELATRDEATELGTPDMSKAFTSDEREAGVFGSYGEEDSVVAASFELAAVSLLPGGFEFAFTAGVLNALNCFEAGVDVTSEAGPLLKKDVRLFCFNESVNCLGLGGIMTVGKGQEKPSLPVVL